MSLVRGQQLDACRDETRQLKFVERTLRREYSAAALHISHESLRPQPVPRVFPTTYDEDARYLAA